MKERTYQEVNDRVMRQIARMEISNTCKLQLAGMLAALQTRHELDMKERKRYWEPDEPSCPFCGCKLSEIREHRDRMFRYCFGCFHEYEVTDE